MRYHETKEGCWKFGGQKVVRVKIGGRRLMSPARAVYETVHGELPFNVVLEARCGDPDCFNPEHMTVRATISDHAGT